jgi:enoyl-[acyl-carrier protein] reductase I
MLNPKASIVTLTYFGAEKTIEGYNAMGVAKAAWQSSIRYLAKDLGKDDIRINAISAGPIKTLSAKGIKYFNGILDVIEQRAPLHRNATAKEIGDVASFLFSDMSNAITGEVIHTDNGFSTIAV